MSLETLEPLTDAGYEALGRCAERTSRSLYPHGFTTQTETAGYIISVDMAGQSSEKRTQLHGSTNLGAFFWKVAGNVSASDRSSQSSRSLVIALGRVDKVSVRETPEFAAISEQIDFPVVGHYYNRGYKLAWLRLEFDVGETRHESFIKGGIDASWLQQTLKSVATQSSVEGSGKTVINITGNFDIGGTTGGSQTLTEDRVNQLVTRLVQAEANDSGLFCCCLPVPFCLEGFSEYSQLLERSRDLRRCLERALTSNAHSILHGASLLEDAIANRTRRTNNFDRDVRSFVQLVFKTAQYGVLVEGHHVWLRVNPRNVHENSGVYVSSNGTSLCLAKQGIDFVPQSETKHTFTLSSGDEFVETHWDRPTRPPKLRLSRTAGETSSAAECVVLPHENSNGLFYLLADGHGLQCVAHQTLEVCLPHRGHSLSFYFEDLYFQNLLQQVVNWESLSEETRKITNQTLQSMMDAGNLAGGTPDRARTDGGTADENSNSDDGQQSLLTSFLVHCAMPWISRAYEWRMNHDVDDSVFVQGLTGAGKSTIINFMLGHRFERVKRPGRPPVVDVTDREKAEQIAVMGSNCLVSETRVPSCYKADRLLLVDNPGWEDTEGDLLNEFHAFVQALFRETASPVRCLLVVIDSQDFRQRSGKMNNIKNVVHNLSQLVGSYHWIEPHIHFVINNSAACEDRLEDPETRTRLTLQKLMDDIVRPLKTEAYEALNDQANQSVETPDATDGFDLWTMTLNFVCSLEKAYDEGRVTYVTDLNDGETRKELLNAVQRPQYFPHGIPADMFRYRIWSPEFRSMLRSLTRWLKPIRDRLRSVCSRIDQQKEEIKRLTAVNPLMTAITSLDQWNAELKTFKRELDHYDQQVLIEELVTTETRDKVARKLFPAHPFSPLVAMFVETDLYFPRASITSPSVTPCTVTLRRELPRGEGYLYEKHLRNEGGERESGNEITFHNVTQFSYVKYKSHTLLNDVEPGMTAGFVYVKRYRAQEQQANLAALRDNIRNCLQRIRDILENSSVVFDDQEFRKWKQKILTDANRLPDRIDHKQAFESGRSAVSGVIENAEAIREHFNALSESNSELLKERIQHQHVSQAQADVARLYLELNREQQYLASLAGECKCIYERMLPLRRILRLTNEGHQKTELDFFCDACETKLNVAPTDGEHGTPTLNPFQDTQAEYWYIIAALGERQLSICSHHYSTFREALRNAGGRGDLTHDMCESSQAESASRALRKAVVLHCYCPFSQQLLDPYIYGDDYRGQGEVHILKWSNKFYICEKK